jgi:hypothetical protein
MHFFGLLGECSLEKGARGAGGGATRVVHLCKREENQLESSFESEIIGEMTTTTMTATTTTMAKFMFHGLRAVQ